MFFGQLVHSCDENNHLTAPSKLGDPLASLVVVTQGFDHNLLAMPMEVFENFSRLVMSLNIADPMARRLQRMLIGNAAFCEIDQAGTITLPSTLKEFAGLTSEAVWVGQGKYLEIWSVALWAQQELDLQDIELNTQRFASLNITGL